jgi:hypothetical protein
VFGALRPQAPGLISFGGKRNEGKENHPLTELFESLAWQNVFWVGALFTVAKWRDSLLSFRVIYSLRSFVIV